LSRPSEDGDRISESAAKAALQEFSPAKGDQPAEYRLGGRNGPDPQEKISGGSLVKGDSVQRGRKPQKNEAEAGERP